MKAACTEAERQEKARTMTPGTRVLIFFDSGPGDAMGLRGVVLSLREHKEGGYLVKVHLFDPRPSWKSDNKWHIDYCFLDEPRLGRQQPFKSLEVDL